MTPEREAEIQSQIDWWRQQERWRVEGFNIVQTDPMYVRLNEHQRYRILQEILTK